jgi:predicted Fe-Mo cluster-binding NifX family protein
MKIAVSSTGPGPDAEVDPRFGRSSYFVIVDGDSMEFEAVENPNVMAAGGAGIQSAQLVADKGASVVLTGHCGPNAYQTLQAAGISLCVGVGGTVGSAVEAYKAGQIKPTEGPSVGSKFGMGGGGQQSGATGQQMGPMGPGMGPGMGWGGMGGGRGMGGGMGRGMGGGMGRGMGGGMGRGMGGGMGRGMGQGMGGVWGGGMGFPGMWPGQTGDELNVLKAQADALKKQLEQIAKRIEELEKGGEG